MKGYLDDTFLLNSEIAERLYFEVAQKQPIVDYHNHINTFHLATNYNYENLTDLWITQDPYKHRSMRILGIDEKYITGESSHKEKFLKWASAVPMTLGNPLFHWTGMELKGFFGIEKHLNENTAEEIWDECNDKLVGEGYGAMDLLKKNNVEISCSSDDLVADLQWHKQLSLQNDQASVLPSMRGDSILDFGAFGFRGWLSELESITHLVVVDLDTFKQAITKRLNEFDELGCVLADHSLDAGFQYEPMVDRQADILFDKVLSARALDADELTGLRSYFLQFLGEEYARRNWTLQLHIGAQRFTSSRLRAIAGSSGGYAGIGTTANITAICQYLDTLEQQENLPDIILYTLNPSDNEVFATLTGSFAQNNRIGKIQFGPAWWYNDHLDGIQRQLMAVANHGILSCFIGMTTDSRSILSLSRHEYFRRIICDMLGQWAVRSEVPNDHEWLGRIVQAVCYQNSYEMITNKIPQSINYQ